MLQIILILNSSSTTSKQFSREKRIQKEFEKRIREKENMQLLAGVKVFQTIYTMKHIAII